MKEIIKTAVITGGTSGIGLATVKLFASRGWRVYSLSRRHGEDLPGVTHIQTDVGDPLSVSLTFAQIAQSVPQIDALVCCAGFGIAGPVELTPPEAVRKQFAVNFEGVYNCMTAAAPMLRAARGIIINVSSAAAVFPIPYQAFYSASKAAINSLSMSAANEMRRFGVRVCALMPGDVKTGFTAAREKSGEKSGLYGDSATKSVEKMEKDEQSGMTAESVAEVIYGLSRKKHPAPLYTAGFSYKCLALLSKLLPARLINFVIAKMYIK